MVLAACAAQPDRPGHQAQAAEDRPATVQKAAAPDRERNPAPVRQSAIDPAIDPASLVGMTGARISSLFGEPVFVRRDGSGEFWRYRGSSCVLELFFYLQDGAQRVRHIETRGAGNKPDKSECVAALRKKPAKS
jgi:hypothetical protein